jgi:glycine/D-amino acid oxidase-like deaminating enzyme
MKDVAIIGGGILGLAIGYELSISHPNFKVTLFEKEAGLGKHQSGNNMWRIALWIILPAWLFESKVSSRWYS